MINREICLLLWYRMWNSFFFPLKSKKNIFTYNSVSIFLFTFSRAFLFFHFPFLLLLMLQILLLLCCNVNISLMLFVVYIFSTLTNWRDMPFIQNHLLIFLAEDLLLLLVWCLYHDCVLLTKKKNTWINIILWLFVVVYVHRNYCRYKLNQKVLKLVGVFYVIWL